MQGLRQEIHTEEPEAGRAARYADMDIIKLACDMADAVHKLLAKARMFFYSVMLFAYRCPKCNGSLSMTGESRCTCDSCGHEFDPTVQFERCTDCGGAAVLSVRRYVCAKCGKDIRSRFLFDGLVFEGEYFRQKMAESRQRKKEQRERVKQMLAESRSADLPLQHADLNAMPGLIDALNSLTAGLDTDLAIEVRDVFNLERYETHIQAHIRDFAVNLTDIPPLSENARKDLIWRFIAVIFLAHAGIVDLLQDGQNILVKKHETDREGQGVPGEPEEADGVEGPLGGVEAW